MLKRFNPLITIRLLHDYHKDKRCEGLSLVPTAECNNFCKRFNLLFRKDIGGGSIHYGKEEGRNALLELAPDPLPLSFLLQSKDSLFINYSDLPFIDYSQFTYQFSNLEKSDSIDPENPVELSKEKYVSEKDLIPIASSVIGRTPFGEVHINLSKSAQSLVLQSDGAPLQYQIHFKNRSTYWRYFILSAGFREFKAFKIVNGHADISFNEPEAVEITGGREALKIVSVQPIPLEGTMEKYFKLELSEQNAGLNTKGISTRINLPSPDIQQIKPEKSGKIYSDMYIYL